MKSHSQAHAVITLTAGLFLSAATQALAAEVPVPDHVVIVMEENHSYSDIIGSANAPYINSLAKEGALFTNSFAIEHPSQPNYLDLFSGSNQGVTDDSCPHSFGVENEGSELLEGGFSFVGYSEDLPGKGSQTCISGDYARKHAPWTNFTNLPANTNLPFSSFPAKYAHLPTVSWVIPNLQDDMHDGTIQEADTWLQNNLSGYAKWARKHNSLLIVTWDEDDHSEDNRIPTIFVGEMVNRGKYKESINHYTVLRTIEAMYGLAPLGNSSGVDPITDVWK